MTDMQLKQSVLDELHWDAQVDAAHIGVTSSDGSVTLNGRVTSYPEKTAAINAAKRVRGVKAVADEIEVHLASDSREDDSDIAERIAHVLEWNVSVPEKNVQAKVRGGIVTLTGEVEWQHERKHVEAQVRHVSGVVGLLNQIHVKPKVSPSNVKAEIEDALFRNAELEADEVRISVSGDTVTLDGQVKAYYERDLVERAAWAAPGVRQVVDHIRIVGW